MSINNILELEIDALIKTVCEYSTDNYIRNYAEKLKGMKSPEDDEKILYLVGKLIKWYEEEIDDINHNEYVISRSAHLESYKLLREMNKHLSR